jgi:hypothetical protein
VLALSLDGRERLLRVTSVSEHGARDVEALSVDPSVYEATPALGRVGRTSAQRASGPPQALFLDLPLLRGDEPEAAGYIAVAQSPWPGSVAILRSPEDTGFARVASADASATVGVLLDPLPPGPIAVFDRATRLRVRLSGDALASVGEAQLFAGANVAAVLGVSGEWEVLQFLTATLVAPSTYELSGLLRAQAGTDIAMAAGAPTGSRFVCIDGKVARVDLVRSEIGLPLRWMVGPAAQPIGGPRAVTTTHAFAGVGLRPLSPAHVRGARASSGDLVLSWVRRTRIGGDTWDVEDVPLGETSESYEVRILAGASVARVLAATEPTVIYTAAQQAADFGIVPTSLTVEIRQRGALGLGSPAHATV